MLNANYLILRSRGLERLAFPAVGRRVLTQSVDVHRRNTRKGKIVHQLLLWGARTGFLRWMSRVPWLTSPALGQPARVEGVDVAEWLTEVAEKINSGPLWAAFAFPPKLAENRIAALVMNLYGERVAFAKISRDEVTDHRVATEANAMDAISVGTTHSFRVPNCMLTGLHDGHRYLLQEPLPEGGRFDTERRPQRLLDALRELSSNVQWCPVHSSDLWSRIDRVPKAMQALARMVAENPSRPIKVTQVHGDFGPGNAYWSEGELWLFDWEEYSPSAPWLVDWISYLAPMASVHAETVQEARALLDDALHRCREHLPDADEWDLALAYLHISAQRTWVANDRSTTVIAKALSEKISHG